MFQLVLLTAPTAVPDEPRLLAELLALPQPPHRLHLRKPDWPTAEVEALIQALPPEQRPRLVLHGHPELVRRYALGGLHLTGRARAALRQRPALLPGQSLSTSLHSLAEITQHRHYDYVFLSPIFDSISKAGYTSGFDLKTVQGFLQEQVARHGYRPRVLALGGITAETLPLARQAGFTGAAILGAVWGCADAVAAWTERACEQ